MGLSNDSSGFFQAGKKLKTKFKRNEEGLEGLPDDYEVMKEKDFEESDECFSCQANLAKNFAGIRKGRHHCRRCGRTVCDRCR